LIDRGGRHLFLVPWRDYTLVGVWHKVFDDLPERITVKRHELNSFVGEVNRAYPAIGISTRDILTINTGLTLFGNQSRQGQSTMSFGKRSLVDHWTSNGLQGLMTLIGVSDDRTRHGEQAIDRVFKARPRAPAAPFRRPSGRNIGLVPVPSIVAGAQSGGRPQNKPGRWSAIMGRVTRTYPGMGMKIRLDRKFSHSHVLCRGGSCRARGDGDETGRRRFP
jgi:hypothetical protein